MRSIWLRALVISCALFCAAFTARALEISEVCPSNAACYKAENGEYPDWIELYNPSDAPLALDGLFISDDSDKLQIASLDGYAIEAGGYLVLRADKAELPFKLSASGCEVILSDESGNILDSAEVPALEKDETYSKQADGSYAVTAATPLKPNAVGSAYVKPVYVASPVFSHASGFYDSGFELSIDAYRTYKVYYTLDLSEPDENSTPYTGEISVTDASYRKNVFAARTDASYGEYSPPNILLPKSTVVKAVAIDENGNKSKVAQGEYFIGYQNRQAFDDIKVVSITTDPEALFNKDYGIYVLGTEYENWLSGEDYNPDYNKFLLPINFLGRGKENEIVARARIFERDRTLSADQPLGLRIHGNTSRFNAKKSLRLFARSEYSSGGSIDFTYMGDSVRGEKLVIRNGGNNQVLCFIDAFAHELLSARGLPTARSEACALFLNGEYWGLYNIREYLDETYIADFYNVKADDIILIKDGGVKAGVAGDRFDYRNTVDLIARSTCETQAEYAAINALIDVDSYTDYLAGGLYIQITDWLNHENDVNVSVWRTRDVGGREYADARWRWIYQDMDVSCGRGDMSTTPVQYLLKEEIFSTLWTNAEYRNKFLTCIMDISNFDCSPQKVNKLLDEYAAYYRKYAELNYARYYPDYTLKQFDSQVEGIRNFFNNRQEQIVGQLRDALQMDRYAYLITVKTTADSSEGVLVNGFAPDFSGGEWTGMYFEGCPVTIFASERAGYDFKGWYCGSDMISDAPECVISLSQDTVCTAVYNEIPIMAALDKNNKPMSGANGETLISSGAFSYAATLSGDDGVISSLADGYTPVFSSDGAFGATLTFDAAGYRDMSAHMTIASDADMSVKIFVSADGDSFSPVDGCEFAISGGGAEFSFAIPSECDDRDGVRLRIETSGGGTLSFTRLILRGRVLNVSLAEHRRVAKQLANEGVAFEYSQETDITQEQVNSEVRLMRAALADARTSSTLKKFKYLNINTQATDGLGESLCFEITAANAAIADSVTINLDGEYSLSYVYLYRLEGDGLSDMGSRDVSNGLLSLDAAPGLYIMLDRPLSEYRYQTRFRTDGIPADLIGNDFLGVAPESHLWLDVEVKSSGYVDIEFEIPSEYGFPNIAPRAYILKDGALTACGRATDAGDGKYSLKSVESGEYLLLPDTLYNYRRSSGAVTEEPKPEAKTTNTMKLIYGSLAALALLTAIGVFIKIRRSK